LLMASRSVPTAVDNETVCGGTDAQPHSSISRRLEAKRAVSRQDRRVAPARVIIAFTLSPISVVFGAVFFQYRSLHSVATGRNVVGCRTICSYRGQPFGWAGMARPLMGELKGLTARSGTLALACREACAARYARTAGPNQVVNASASPVWVGSPTQTTY